MYINFIEFMPRLVFSRLNLNEIFKVVDAALEKEIQKLADKDGTISKQVFMKYAFSTHLCKEDPQELVSI